MQRKNSEDLNTCAIFNLVTKRTKMDTKLTEHKKYVSLCSTFKYIFCIGGYKASLGCLQTNEYFNSEDKAWKRLSPLNNAQKGICSYFDKIQYLYSLGGEVATGILSQIERFNITNLQSSWQLTKIAKFSSFYSGCIQLNQKEILIHEGFKSSSFYYLFDLNSFAIRKMKGLYQLKCAVHSKSTYSEGFVWNIVKTYPYILLYRLDLLNMEIRTSNVDF